MTLRYFKAVTDVQKIIKYFKMQDLFSWCKIKFYFLLCVRKKKLLNSLLILQKSLNN